MPFIRFVGCLAFALAGVFFGLALLMRVPPDVLFTRGGLYLLLNENVFTLFIHAVVMLLNIVITIAIFKRTYWTNPSPPPGERRGTAFIYGWGGFALGFVVALRVATPILPATLLNSALFALLIFTPCLGNAVFLSSYALKRIRGWWVSGLPLFGP